MADHPDSKDAKDVELQPVQSGDLKSPTPALGSTQGLRRVPGKIPLAALLILSVELGIYAAPARSLHVWVQAPAYVLVALSEAFVVVTGLELAYTQAPTNLRSVVSSLFWLTIGVAAAVSVGLGPVSQDPYLVWTYGALAVVGLVAGCAFYACFFRARKAYGREELTVEGEKPQG